MPTAAQEPEAPWYVRAMLGIAGWIAAIMLLATSVAFFGELFDNATTSAVFGLALCVVSLVIYRSASSGNFARQFAFAFSLTGQAFLIFGLSKFFGFTLSMNAGLYSLIPVALVTLGLMLPLFLLIPEYLHRIWCAMLAVLAMGFILIVYSATAYILPIFLGLAAVLWLNELKWLRWGNALRAIAYALVFGCWLHLLFQTNAFNNAGSFYRLFGCRCFHLTALCSSAIRASGTFLLCPLWRGRRFCHFHECARYFGRIDPGAIGICTRHINADGFRICSAPGVRWTFLLPATPDFVGEVVAVSTDWPLPVGSAGNIRKVLGRRREQ